MKPIVGITASVIDTRLQVKETYLQAILSNGALPVVMAYASDADQIDGYLRRVDGLLISGGADVDPAYYGEEPLPVLGKIFPARDRFEIALIREAARRDIPILAICRGMQVVNVAMGGSLYQDVSLYRPDVLQHMQPSAYHVPTHTVEIAPDTQLHRIMGRTEIRTNSMHHQSVKEPAPGFVVSAKAKDGVIEAIESPSHRFFLAVQWHPEELAAHDPMAQRLFRAWIEACSAKH
jgi:putative glutamine amidotransferase